MVASIKEKGVLSRSWFVPSRAGVSRSCRRAPVSGVEDRRLATSPIEVDVTIEMLGSL
jgi:hypothetical protein